jgi:AmmeMemoRadiSam system protein B
MRAIQAAAVMVVVAFAGQRSPAAVADTQPPTRSDVEAEMGLRSEGDLVRGQLDTVGFPVTAAQAEDVVATALGLEGLDGVSSGEPLLGGVCPHDDHLYAASVYVHLTQRISAPRVLLFGVFHKAREWQIADRVVFDSFRAWHGPWGPVPVDPLRDELIAALDPGSYVVDNAMHCREHSLEAIVPFLQARTREVTIVPVLVPYMRWSRIEALSAELAGALNDAMQRHGWQLGRDLAIVVSSDAVHYGDDFDHAPFGTDAEGYQQAVARDLELARRHLEGPLAADRLAGLLGELVDEGDLRRYRIPWCGRFSIPFGLELLRTTAALSGAGVPQGVLLRYGTSLSEPELPVSQATRETGLGKTAPSNLHHWVGYAAVGYSLGGVSP